MHKNAIYYENSNPFCAACLCKEMAARYEENAHLFAVLRSLGNKKVYLYELQGFDHGNMYAPGCLLMVDYIKKQKGN